VNEHPMLPDYLAKDLDIIFVGLNPSLYSARVGHYFANPRNRFWAALNQSGLVGRELSPEQDASLLDYRIGFTDVVKRPTSQASGLSAADYRQWAPVLKAKLLEYQPRIACFHGLTGYKAYLRYAEGVEEKPLLGLQERTIGQSRVFVVPNPSPANARFSIADLVYWYQQLKKLRGELTH
jgi:TDG/mug DNA glycosylase family protein